MGQPQEPSYLPSPEEIRERCVEIQQAWSARKQAKRCSGSIEPWTVPNVSPSVRLGAWPRHRRNSSEE
jgi:hypothetical protein